MKIDMDNMNINTMISMHNVNKLEKVLLEYKQRLLLDFQQNFVRDKITYEELERMKEINDHSGISGNDYYLFLSAYISIESILNYDRNKMLIFVNSISDINKIYNLHNINIGLSFSTSRSAKNLTY